MNGIQEVYDIARLEQRGITVHAQSMEVSVELLNAMNWWRKEAISIMMGKSAVLGHSGCVYHFESVASCGVAIIKSTLTCSLVPITSNCMGRECGMGTGSRLVKSRPELTCEPFFIGMRRD
jgi:hypothetical protein